MKNNKLSITFKLFVLIICMTSFGAWFLQPFSGPLFVIIFSMMMIIIRRSDKDCFKASKRNNTWFLLLFVVTLLMCIGMNLNGYIVALVGLIPTFLIFSLKSEYKEELLAFLIKSLGVMLLISLPFYFLYLMGVNLPSFEIVRESSENNVDFHFTVFYFFTIKDDGDLLSILLPRYQFVFYEPGYFGCLMAVLLYLGNFRFDKSHWENYVFLISLALSLSLAGTLIALFSYVVFFIRNSKHRFQWIFASLLVMGGLYLTVTNYNGGDNVVNDLFFSRFKYDEASGEIAGNSRFSSDVSDYFWKKFIYSDELMLGMKNPDNVLNNNNVDYLSFIMRRGLLVFIAFLAFLFYPLIERGGNRYNKLCLVAMYLLIFLQGSACVFWAFYLFILVLGINKINQGKMEIKHQSF